MFECLNVFTLKEIIKIDYVIFFKRMNWFLGSSWSFSFQLTCLLMQKKKIAPFYVQRLKRKREIHVVYYIMPEYDWYVIEHSFYLPENILQVECVLSRLII